jgi:hypothetical protein
LIAACGSGLYLYSEKHRTAMLDREIGRTIHDTEAARAKTGLLRAEWALLNEPGRLQDMAERYLTLKPMAPTQFVQLADLAAHLPPPAALPASSGTTDDDETPSAVASNDAAASDLAAAPPPASMMTAPVSGTASGPAAGQDPLASAPDPRAGVKLVAHADAKPRAAHRVTLADRQDPPHYGLVPHGTPLPLAAPQPMGASVYSALARPMPVSRHRPVIVAAVPSYAPARVSSALGGRDTLPPPVPYDGQ